MHETRQRSLAISTAVVFLISSAFPVVAAFVKDTKSWPKWWGVLDVSIAFFLAILVFVICALARGRLNQKAEHATYRAYRVLLHGIFLMMVIFYLAGDRIKWSQCLTGFAWRAWLLFYALPWWFAAFRTNAG
jgi:hypothetical protein